MSRSAGTLELLVIAFSARFYPAVGFQLLDELLAVHWPNIHTNTHNDKVKEEAP